MQFNNPIPVSVNGRKAMALYVKSGPSNEDIWCVSFIDGSIGYFNSNEIRTEIKCESSKPMDYGLSYLMNKNIRQPI